VFYGSYGQGIPAIGFYWQFGESAVVLNNGDILQGPLILDCNKNMIQIKANNDSLYSLSAQSVQGFAVRKEQTVLAKESYVALERIFYSYPIRVRNSDSIVWTFLEQLNQGSIVLYRHIQQNMEDDLMTINSDGTFKINNNSYLKFITKYYVKDKNGDINLLKNNKDILKYFSSNKKRIINYIAENNLKYNNARDLSFIMNYANSLSVTSP
jgi:hypothetical protein